MASNVPRSVINSKGFFDLWTERGLTVKAFAAAAGKTPSWGSKVIAKIRARKGFQPAQLSLIAQALGIEQEELLGLGKPSAKAA